ncbi:MAG TPA: TolC family protein [Thermoanaerobaculia bacterium]|nr:TolC family protein [Thermoanaerobaculia bacterium]
MRSNARTRRGGAIFATASLLGLLALPGAAQTQTTTPTSPATDRRISTEAVRPAEPPPVEATNGVIELSLEEAITIALRQNLGLVSQRYARTQSRLGITQSQGIYDLLTQARAAATDSETPSLSAFQANEFQQQDVDFSLTQRLPTGGDLSFGWTTGRRESPEDPERPGLTESYDTGATFSFTQPLLRNFGRIINERGIYLARTDDRISHEEFERQVVLTVQEVINAYWDLVEAQEQVKVAQESLALARELHERNRIQVDVGTLPPLELVQSEAAIATRDEDIIRTTAVVGDAADQLRRLLNVPPGPLWEAEIRPTTEPQAERLDLSVDQSIQLALAERPELRQQELAIERNRINARFFRNQTLPDLDLNLRYNTPGFGLGFNEAFEQITGFDFRVWSVSLDFAFPIQNRSARAASAIANLDVERAETELDNLRAVIATEVRQAVRAVETAAQQIEASRISREFQEKNLDAERKRYENGMSTSFQITQIQEELTRARSREVAAVINYRVVLANYYRATGRLLDIEGVAIEDEPTPEGAVDWWSFDRSPLPGENRGR